ncbi:non-heme iron oxygenase ferredoxin subunit [Jatrophihabitans sp. YIM 134969]
MTVDPSQVDADGLVEWTEVGPADAIEVNTAQVLALTPPVAVFHLEDGFHATDDTCTHAEYSLGSGWIEDGRVECELHFAAFDIRTGKAATPPASVDLATYPVVVVDGVVYVDLRGRQGCAIAQLKQK